MSRIPARATLQGWYEGVRAEDIRGLDREFYAMQAAGGMLVDVKLLFANETGDKSWGEPMVRYTEVVVSAVKNETFEQAEKEPPGTYEGVDVTFQFPASYLAKRGLSVDGHAPDKFKFEWRGWKFDVKRIRMLCRDSVVDFMCAKRGQAAGAVFDATGMSREELT